MSFNTVYRGELTIGLPSAVIPFLITTMCRVFGFSGSFGEIRMKSVTVPSAVLSSFISISTSRPPPGLDRRETVAGSDADRPRTGSPLA